MLTVPAQIQALFKTDGINKNFRVHFPNGENADLTNADIVTESVRFTESVCSKEVFQFGLSERSQIEFECVNVQNIYGMTIECGIEIDTTSLSAADISTIAGNPGDGVLVLEAASDIGYGFYRVPYGTFIVDKCPRSHGAMWRRQVSAYSPNYIVKPTLSALTQKKFNFTSQTGNKMVLNLYAFNAGEAGSLDGLNYTTASTTTPTSTNTNISEAICTVGGNQYVLVMETVTSKTTSPLYANVSLIRSTCTYDDAFLTWITNNIPAGAEINDIVMRRAKPHIRWGSNYTDGFILPDPEDTGIIYPYATNIDDYYYIEYTSSVKCHIERNGTTIASTQTFTPCDNINGTRYTLTGEQRGMILAFDPTFGVAGQYRYFDSIDWGAMYDGQLEINGAFGRPARMGGIEVIHLATTSPENITPAMYSELWWDDYSIDAIGTVRISYYDADEQTEQTVNYVIGSGTSVYDMTSNYMLKHLAATAADIGAPILDYVESLIDNYFVPNITGVAFTPTDMTMIGLPYLEAGEYLAVDDSDGGTVSTYMLRRSISGLQTMFDTVEASGGEIIAGVQ